MMNRSPWLLVATVVLAVAFVVLIITVLSLYFTRNRYISSKQSSKMKIALNPPVFSTGELKSPEIQLRYISGLLSDEECAHIIQLAEGHFEESNVLQGLKSQRDSSYRTSSTYHIPVSHDTIIRGIESRVAMLVGKPKQCIEGLQVVKYDKGQEFKAHWDYFYPEYESKIKNQRQYTFFVYLNNLPSNSGGETSFPKLKLEFTPKKGDALFWVNCDAEKNCSEFSFHQGKPPTREGAKKYGLNIWVDIDPVSK